MEAAWGQSLSSRPSLCGLSSTARDATKNTDLSNGQQSPDDRIPPRSPRLPFWLSAPGSYPLSKAQGSLMSQPHAWHPRGLVWGQCCFTIPSPAQSREEGWS